METFFHCGILVAKLTGGMKSGWKPYHIANGDFPVALCCLALWANSMKGTSLVQLSCSKLQKMQKYCSNSWLTLSVSPSVCGWWAVDMVNLTPSFVQISCMTFDANCGPQSDITWRGSPVLLQTFSRYNLEVSSAVMVLLQGLIIVALLKWSTTTNSELYPWDMGRSMIKSMVIISQMSAGTWLGCRGTWFLGLIFMAWHVVHPST